MTGRIILDGVNLSTFLIQIGRKFPAGLWVVRMLVVIQAFVFVVLVLMLVPDLLIGK